MLAAELLLVPGEIIPPTVTGLRRWLADIEASGILQVTEGARKVADLFLHPPEEAEWRPVLRGVSRLAFATLPRSIRDMYGFDVGRAKRTAVQASLAATKALRPLLPPKYRYIAPYAEWRLLQRGKAPRSQAADVRRSVGIRLDGTRSIPGEG
jgi:hypothetical protein